MATQLFFRTTLNADTHLGTDNTNLRGTNLGWWAPSSLSTSRGSGVTVTTANTITGPTAGLEMGWDGTLQAYEFFSPPIAADVTISGTITLNIWAAENNMSANVAINAVIDVVRANTLTTRNSNTIVEIARSTRTTELAVTTRAVNNFTVTPTSTTVNRGDRLRVRIFGDDSAASTMAAGFTFSVGTDGTTAAVDGDTYVTFTENFSFEPTSPGVLSQTVHGQDDFIGNAVAKTRMAQSFVALSNGSLSEVKIWLLKAGSPTDDLIFEVQGDSAGSPDGSSLVTVATVNGAALTGAQVEYTYTPSVTLTPGTTYWLVGRRSGAVDAANYYRWGGSGVPSSSAGTAKTYDGSNWGAHSSSVWRFAWTLTFPTSTLYLTNTASDVATASTDYKAWTTRGGGVVTSVTNTAAGWTAPIQATGTAGGTVLDWFTPGLAAFTLTGMAVANIRALESNAAANASLRCELARVNSDGTSPTVWSSWCCAPTGTDNGELTTSEVARTINVSGDDLAFTDGQRIRIRLYNDDISSAAMGASQTVTRYYSGTSGGASGDTYITLPQTVTEFASGPYTYTKAGYGKESA